MSMKNETKHGITSPFLPTIRDFSCANSESLLQLTNSHEGASMSASSLAVERSSACDAGRTAFA